ncbi:hypothetical protein ACQRBN_10440 [Bariatricus sp. SGI.154]|uniref:hypothetical protein n=1 Tax=Bariatricus sp. SGI.154 TaxID=3420549 RepID=UPI003D039009
MKRRLCIQRALCSDSFAFYVAQIIRVFQIGIDKCLESGFEELELGAVGSVFMTLGPVVAGRWRQTRN